MFLETRKAKSVNKHGNIKLLYANSMVNLFWTPASVLGEITWILLLKIEC